MAEIKGMKYLSSDPLRGFGSVGEGRGSEGQLDAGEGGRRHHHPGDVTGLRLTQNAPAAIAAAGASPYHVPAVAYSS